MVLWAACWRRDNRVHWKETYWDVYWLIELVKTGWVGWGSSCLCQFVGCNQKIQISILWIRLLCCDLQHGEQPFMPDDHSDVVPLLPISNRTVKRVSADDSADSRVKVGHCQAWQWPTFTRESALSSALTRFTVLFEMGRSGTTSLWSSGINGCSPCCKSQQSKRIHRIEICIFWLQPTNWHKQLEPQPTQPVFTNSISQYTSQYVSFQWTLLSRRQQAAHNTIKVIGSSLTSN